MKTIVNPLLRCLPLLLAACTGGGGAGPGADGRGSADGRGVDAEEPPADAPGTDWFHEEDRRRPPPEGRLALRFEVRFGTTDAWKGLSLLAPSGLYHTEAADVGACAGSLDDMFLSQLEGAVDAADPWSWGAAGRTGTACGSQAFRYVLHLEDLFDGLSMDSDWCGPDEDAVPGRAEIVKKIQMLNAWVDQNGDCGVMPRILGKPVAVAAAGLDDGTGTGFAVARFEDPDFCTIAYITYTGEVYRSNRPIDMDQDTADAVAAGMAPVEGDLKTLATEICPEAAEFMFSPAVLTDNGLEAVVAVVGQGPSGPAAWLAVGGLATLVLPAEAPDGHMEEKVHLTELSLFRVESPGMPSAKVKASVWEETVLESTAFAFPVDTPAEE